MYLFKAFFSESSCQAFAKLSDLPPIYGIQNKIAETFHFDGFTIGQLVNSTLEHNYTHESLAFNITETGGIDAVVWVGCDNSSKAITYQVCISRYCC